MIRTVLLTGDRVRLKASSDCTPQEIYEPGMVPIFIGAVLANRNGDNIISIETMVQIFKDLKVPVVSDVHFVSSGKRG